jgi:Sulfotransferase family
MRLLRRRARERAPAPFIVGVPRSGTTLLRLMLDAHPTLAIPPETYFAPDLIARCREGTSPEDLIAMLTSHRRWGDFGVEADELEARFARLDRLAPAPALRAFYELYAEGQDKPRWGDKTPRYIRSMLGLCKVLPEARFIHVIRDGRDAAVSHAEATVKEPKSMRRQARRWKRRIRKARAQAPDLPGYIEVRYEDLVRNPEAQLRRVCELIELDWDPRMLAYHAGAGDRMAEIARGLPAASGRVAKRGEDRLAGFKLTAEPPRTNRIARWRERMSEAERVEYEEIAGDLLAELGYEVGVPVASARPGETS